MEARTNEVFLFEENCYIDTIIISFNGLILWLMCVLTIHHVYNWITLEIHPKEIYAAVENIIYLTVIEATNI